MRLKCLKLKNGEQISITNRITVFVGPNNSGKSQTLKDLRSMLDKNRANFSSTVILDDDNSVFEVPSHDQIMNYVSIRSSKNSVDQYNIEGIVSDLLNRESIGIHKSQKGSIGSRDLFFEWFSKYYLALMNAETRLKLSSQVSSFNAEEDIPSNLVQALLLDSDAELRLQKAFHSAFGEDIKLDYSLLQSLCLRVAEKMPDIPKDVREAIKVTKDIPKIDDQGDGFRSYVGIVLGLLLCKERIILLDEPEAFLHPSQAYSLGKWISDEGNCFESQLFVCTHSSSFLNGLLDGETEVSIFRLNREGNTTSFLPISSESTKQLSVNPILSSQRVIEGLFHKGVVICEADSDRAVYQSVASINLNSNREILFIHAHNKQTIALVAEALKNASVPCAAIVDIDVLHGKDDLSKIYSALTQEPYDESVEEKRVFLEKYVESRSEEDVFNGLKQSVEEFYVQLKEGKHDLEGAKAALKRIRGESTKWSAIKKGGLNALDIAHRNVAQALFERLASIGFFVVPVGELESWMELGERKGKWIVSALRTIQDEGASIPLKSFVKQVLSFFG